MPDNSRLKHRSLFTSRDRARLNMNLPKKTWPAPGVLIEHVNVQRELPLPVNSGTSTLGTSLV